VTGAPAIPLIADPLAEALHFLRMDGVFYCRSELTGPWGIDMPPMDDTVFFHVVTRGDCWLVDATGRRWRLRAGDLAVLPHGTGHAIADAPDSATCDIFDIPHDQVTAQYAILRHGGGGEQVSMICGGVRFGHPAARSLVEMLPPMIHVEATTERAEWQWLPALLALMADETRTTRAGGEAVVTRLSDILVIQAIRAWIDTDPGAQTGWLGALHEPRIGHAIAMIHRAPERDWSLASLAAEVAMSRSSFAARFTALVGEPAMQYVTRWRMTLAVDLLGEGQLSIAQIAERLGYGSEAAFGRAFKRMMGEPPGVVRRRAAPPLAGTA
jgi:AraC-like DNA-binding protein